MAKIAFLGLGVMGYPMAGHLLKKGGHDVTVYNRTAAKSAQWVKEYGGKSAATPKEAVAGADLVAMCLGNDDDVRSVVYGDSGALAGIKKGALLVDHTTASAILARELHAACQSKGIGFVDAPVSGGQAGAVNGQLGVMCGGEQVDFDRAKPVLDLYAKSCVLIGSPGAGQLTKMVNQIAIAGLLQGLDIALGVGGLPRGRVVEIYGPESSGKTTLTLQVIAEMQKMGGTAAFIDAENALDISYAAKLGVKTEDLLISQPDTGEQALEIADMLVRSGAVDVIVVDSVAALTPKAEIEGEMGEPQMGLQARLMSQALRKLTGNIKRTNTLVIFINQIRMKIGVMFGNPETTTGGNALKFYASVRMDIRRIGAIKKGDEVVGSETRVKVVKNKVAPPFRNAEFDIMYGEGISREGEILELGVAHNVVDKSGAWYIYKGDRLGQGKDNCREYLREHPELAREIETKIREAVGVAMPTPAAAAESAEAGDNKVEQLPTRKRGGERA